jgi:hypothetical protein
MAGVGDGSPGSREAEGEGGEGFYIAQSGRCPDLLVILGGGGTVSRSRGQLARDFATGPHASHICVVC